MKEITSYTSQDNPIIKELSTMNKKEERNLKRFRHTPIVVLDTCVCRALYEDNGYQRFEELKRIKDSGVNFCVSDIALTELEISLARESIKPDQWRVMMDRLNGIVSPLFPMIESSKQLFEMAEVSERKTKRVPFDYKKASEFSRNHFMTSFSYKNKDSITYIISDAEKGLNNKKNHWIEFLESNIKMKDVFKKIILRISKNKDKSEDIRTNIIASMLMKELDAIFYSIPNFSTRIDILIRYMARTILRSINSKESFNVYCNKRKNDGIDFVLLEALMLPARICTYDKMNNIKLIKSYQSNWILSPENLFHEFNETNILTKLCFETTSLPEH